MDRETFDTMWTMSEAGETEGCFLRLPQVEYYADDRVTDSLSWMPEVPSSSFCLFWVDRACSSGV